MDYLKLIRMASDIAWLSKEENEVLANLLVALKDNSPAEMLHWHLDIAFREEAIRVQKEIA